MFKKIVLVCCVIALSVTTSKAQEPSDTVRVIQNPASVQVTRDESGAVTLTVRGNSEDANAFYSVTNRIVTSDTVITTRPGEEDWGLTLPFLSSKKKSRSNMLWAQQTHIGIPFALNAPDGLDQSLECGIGQVVGVSYSPWHRGPAFSIGAGFYFQQWALHSGNLFAKEGDCLLITPSEDGCVDRSSRLWNFGLTIPFVITQSIYKEFSVAVGVAANFNTYTNAYSRYTKDNVRYEIDIKGLRQRILSYELYAALGWSDGMSVYVRYNPNSLFKSNYGPKFETLSVGLTIGL